jgi:hypothetical protein
MIVIIEIIENNIKDLWFILTKKNNNYFIILGLSFQNCHGVIKYHMIFYNILSICFFIVNPYVFIIYIGYTIFTISTKHILL